MKVKLIDENTYGIFDDSGTEVGKGAITAEMRARVRKNKTLSKVVKEAVEADLGAAVDDMPAELIQTAEPVTVPFHEHPYDDRYAAAEHPHDYAARDHDHDHSHPEMPVFKGALEFESQQRAKADDEIRTSLKSHPHPEKADFYHTHEDIAAQLNNLRNQVVATESRIPAGVAEHFHADVNEAINTSRSEITSLRNAITSAENRLLELVERATGQLRAEMGEIQPKGDYAMKSDLEALTSRKGQWIEVRRSEENVAGSRRIILTLEELP